MNNTLDTLIKTTIKINQLHHLLSTSLTNFFNTRSIQRLPIIHHPSPKTSSKSTTLKKKTLPIKRTHDPLANRRKPPGRSGPTDPGPPGAPARDLRAAGSRPGPRPPPNGRGWPGEGPKSVRRDESPPDERRPARGARCVMVACPR